ncbi:uncharacterized protein LOC144129869 [Amblyomma americanum]
MFEDVVQSIDAKDLKKLSVKPCCSGGAGVPISSSALSGIDAQLQGHDGGKAVSISDDCQDGSTDEASEVGDVEVTRRGSPVSCCCGDNRGFNVRDTQRDDMTGVVVASGGRFPCLHIGLTGLRLNRRYFLALDFVEISGGGAEPFTPYDYTEPYYAPRPNNLAGMQWMDGILYFSLNSIANGGLQESGTTLKVGGEYEPTLRLLELRDDQWPSGSSAIRFPLRGTAFLVVSLSSEVRTSRTALASEFLLVRRSEMSRSRFPSQQQQQPAQQDCFHSSPSSRGMFPESASTSAPATQQPDWRRLLELRAGRAATASRLLRMAGATPKHHGLQALPATPDPLSSSGVASVRTVYPKPAVHDHFSGGVWKSLPPQPAQQLPQQPVGSGAWHSSSTRQHSCLAPGAHLELGALLQGMQLNREALSSLIEQQSGLPQQQHQQQQQRSLLFGFGGLGSGSLPPAEHRTSMPPFGPGASTTAATHALRECWSRSAPPNSSTPPPLLRFNYDVLPSGYVHWLALARSSLSRPPQNMSFSGLDHAQQLHHDHHQQQQPMQDMGVQTAYPSTAASSEEAEQGAGDAVNPITTALSFNASNSGVCFAPSTASGAQPPSC